MPTFAIGGVEVPIAMNTLRETRRDVGGMSVAYSGTPRLSRIAIKRDLEFETVPIAQQEADAWASLLSGDGFGLPFDSNAYTSKGEPPASNAGSWAPVVSGLFPGLVGNVGTGDGYGDVTWNNLPTNYLTWSAIMWRSTFCGSAITSLGAPFEHWIVRSDGKVYRNGVQASTTGVIGVAPNQTWFTFSSGTMHLNTEASLIGMLVRDASNNLTAAPTGSSLLGNTGASGAGSGSVYWFRNLGAPGTTGAAPPTWNIGIGNTTTDGSVTWTCMGVARGRLFDFALIRGLAPASWGLQAAASSYPSVIGTLPKYLVVADILPEGSRTMMCDSYTSRTIRAGGAWYVVLSVKLTEV